MIINLNKKCLLDAFLSLALSSYSVTSVWAAPNLPDSANLPRVDTQPAFPNTSNPVIEKKEEFSYPAALPESAGVKVKVSHFKFTGNKNISNNQLLLLLNDYKDQSLGIKELNRMTVLITDYYRQQGFMLAQAYLPEQDITQDSLEIAIIEGYLGELKLKTSGQLDEAFLQRMASNGLESSAAIRESNLVRNVTLINSLPGLSASSQLTPGRDVGYSDVEINVDAKPRFTGFLTANNYGNRYTGREVLGASLFLNNLAGRGDRLNLNLKTSSGAGQRSAQVGYVVPVLDSGSMLNLSTGYLDYKLGGQFSSLGAKGDSYYVSALLDQPVLRSRLLNITSRYGVTYKDISDEVSSFNLDNHRGIGAIELGLFGDWRNTGFNGFNQLGLNLKLADVNFKNTLAKNLDSTGANTAGNFIKYNLFASHLQPITTDFNLRLMGEYQGTSKNLDSSEKLSVGGANRWREFADIPTSADRGLIVGAEVRRAMLPIAALANAPTFLQTMEMSPYVFYDYSRGNINHNALTSDNHVRSSHYGIGVDAILAKKWILDLTASHQNSRIDGLASEAETRAWVQVQMEFQKHTKTLGNL